MSRPIIGVTAFSLDLPCSRSAVNQAYIDAIVSAGGAPICIPVGLDAPGIDSIYGLIDGLLLPGGDDVAPRHYGQPPHPALGQIDELRDVLELSLTRRALEDDLPILAICRGIQVLAVAAGGTLYQDLPSELPSEIRHEVREFGRDHLSHSIDVEPNSHLGHALGASSLCVNSFHHQAVRAIPEGFTVTATSPDGVVEGIEATASRFTVGVQCHPEEMWETTGRPFERLFRDFVEAVRERCVPSRPLAV